MRSSCWKRRYDLKELGAERSADAVSRLPLRVVFCVIAATTARKAAYKRRIDLGCGRIVAIYG